MRGHKVTYKRINKKIYVPQTPLIFEIRRSTRKTSKHG